MFIGLTQTLDNGASFPLTLRFEKAGEVKVDVQGQEPGPGADDDAQALTRSAAPAAPLGVHLFSAFSASLMPSLTPTSGGSAFSAACASRSL